MRAQALLKGDKTILHSSLEIEPSVS